jgi:hypothetical protein
MLNIYVKDLIAENKGIDCGEWITLPQFEEDLETELSNIIKCGRELCGDNENHKDLIISKYKWDGLDIFDIDKNDCIYQLNDKIELLENIDDYQLKAIKFLIADYYHDNTNIEELIEKAEEVTIYENSTMADVANSIIDNCYNLEDIPDIIANNIDYEGIGRLLEMDGFYHKVGRDVYEYPY